MGLQQQQENFFVDKVVSDQDSRFKELSDRLAFLESQEPPNTLPNYILIRDEEAQGTASGTFTSGAWQTRTLNTEVLDTGNHASLAANQITLQPGTYEVFAWASAYLVQGHQCRLQNITDGTTIALGTSAYSDANDLSPSVIQYRFTLTTAKVLELQHRCEITRISNGYGLRAN